ncbi:MAG: hypothetical protein ACLT8E_04855 [Akkermansia sp.]
MLNVTVTFFSLPPSVALPPRGQGLAGDDGGVPDIVRQIDQVARSGYFRIPVIGILTSRFKPTVPPGIGNDLRLPFR